MSVESKRSLRDEPRAELREAWHELLTAARDFGYAVDELICEPATPEQITAAEQVVGRRLPDHLVGLYLLSDGQRDWLQLVEGPAEGQKRERGRWVGSLFGEGWSFNTIRKLESDYRSWADLRAGYTADELAAEFDDMIEVRGNDPVMKRYTCPDWIAFATDGGGNSLAVDLAPEPGGTDGQVIVIGPDEDLRRVIAPTVLELLRLCTSRLRAPVAASKADRGICLYTLEVPEPSAE